MAKVYCWGKYREIDPKKLKNPHKDIAYSINGRRYKMILCHFEGSVLRGYNTHKKKWFDLFEEYVQMDGAEPIGAKIIEGEY